MVSETDLTLGFIPYLNCVPFFSRLKENGFQGELVSGVPSDLNRRLQNDELDASPSSSFEYARNWRDYFILPDHSISSVGAVKSVLLFTPETIEDLGSRTIALTGESATSIHLLRVLFHEFYQLHQVKDGVPREPIETLVAEKQPALLIGDRALRLSQNLPEGVMVYDLGELWYRHTGLPFVFALWMVRKKSWNLHREDLSQLSKQLFNSRHQVLERAEAFAKKASALRGLSSELVINYWNTIDYRLDEEHLQGLKLFFRLCKKYEFLPEEPELNFLPLDTRL